MKSFGRYQLQDLLGRGGMGEVWRAYDTQTDRVVALKLLTANLIDDSTFQERFRREARMAAGLNDPHVVPIHQFGEIDGRLYVDMRLIEGSDLQALLDSERVAPQRAVYIVEQVASALHAAHRVGLVHRDVKPSNILLAEDDFAYLIDFGIARAAGDSGLTGTGATIGTWTYMAPERFSTGQTDGRADVYALACVLHQALTGQTPFPGDSLEQQYIGHMSTDPPRPSAINPEVPAGFDDVIANGMAKAVEKRYPTTKDLAKAARDALAETPPPVSGEHRTVRLVPTPPMRPPTAPPPPLRKPTRRESPPPPSRPITQRPPVTNVGRPAPRPPSPSTRRQPTSMRPDVPPPVSRPITPPAYPVYQPPPPQEPPETPAAQPEPAPKSDRKWLVVAAVGAVAVVGAVALIAALTLTGGSDTTPGETTTAARTTTTTTPSMAADLVNAAQLNGLLLPPADLNAIMGATEMAVKETGDAMFADEVDPAGCIGVWGVLIDDFYAGSPWLAVSSQIVRELDDAQWKHTVFQGVVNFDSAAKAEDFVQKSRGRFAACANKSVSTVPDPGKAPMTWSLGALTEPAGMLVMPATQEGGSGYKCQRALTSRKNVVVDVRACGYQITDQGFTVASRTAERIR